jgi:hypothetical protein
MFLSQQYLKTYLYFFYSKEDWQEIAVMAEKSGKDYPSVGSALIIGGHQRRQIRSLNYVVNL